MVHLFINRVHLFNIDPMLAGRVEAFANYVVHEKYSITREMCAAMLGFELPTEVETAREEADA